MEDKRRAPRSKEQISYQMSRIKGKDTSIEMKVRRALFAKGYRFRVNCTKVFGRPDILFPKLRLAIFCDSEFWHGYNFEENKKHIHSHESYWLPKIERNIERDKEVNEELTRQGYRILRFWGFEINREFDRVISEIEQAIEEEGRYLELEESIKERTTLGYLERDGRYLMLYRNKKKDDLNAGKWVGIGGHLEEGESPLQCFKREVLEESGLTVNSAHYLGQIDFLNDAYPPERMYLFVSSDFTGEVRECDEGELSFIPRDEVMSLPLWEGDKAFLPLLDPKGRPFKMKLLYSGDRLIRVVGPLYPKGKKRKKIKRHGHQHQGSKDQR